MAYPEDAAAPEADAKASAKELLDSRASKRGSGDCDACLKGYEEMDDFKGEERERIKAAVEECTANVEAKLKEAAPLQIQ